MSTTDIAQALSDLAMEQDVNHPTRYTKGFIECIDALEAAVVGKVPGEAIYVANIIKYLWRYEEKEPLRSLKSAKWYLDRLIEKVARRLSSDTAPICGTRPDEAKCGVQDACTSGESKSDSDHTRVVRVIS